MSTDTQVWIDTHGVVPNTRKHLRVADADTECLENWKHTATHTVRGTQRTLPTVIPDTSDTPCAPAHYIIQPYSQRVVQMEGYKLLLPKAGHSTASSHTRHSQHPDQHTIDPKSHTMLAHTILQHVWP